MRILCICAQGINRSGYAARYFAARGHETRKGGSEPDAPNPVSQEDLDWAEVVVYARMRHRDLVHERFEVDAKEFSLDVSDDPANVPEVWRRVLAEDPDKFYREYTFPRMEDALEELQQKL